MTWAKYILDRDLVSEAEALGVSPDVLHSIAPKTKAYRRFLRAATRFETEATRIASRSGLTSKGIATDAWRLLGGGSALSRFPDVQIDLKSSDKLARAYDALYEAAGEVADEASDQAARRYLNPKKSDMQRTNPDPLTKFIRTSGDLTPIFGREDLRDTRRRVEFPVGTVVSLLDRTGYHDFQAVVAHPTVIETPIADMVGIATPHGYDFHELRWFEGDAHEVSPEHVRPEMRDVIRRVRRTVGRATNSRGSRKKLKNSLMR